MKLRTIHHLLGFASGCVTALHYHKTRKPRWMVALCLASAALSIYSLARTER